ncbi:C-C motif chemokine 4-like [Oncorhynchus masou masou]|uniref:C-C motif chemokine 4-like n=1 Tax=Oncorhynchus masou masou TaxID=90313 RepID=UPI00318321D3
MQLCYGPMACLALFAVILSLTATDTDANKVHNCCTTVSKQKITVPIIGARLQKKALPCVNAVIFETDNGETICSYWKESWVRKAFFQLEMARKSMDTQVPTANSPTTSP